MVTEGLRIALVDGEAAQQLALTRWLESAGALVAGFPCAADFLNSYKSETFDVVLLDWDLPDMSGTALVVRIRALRGMTTPIIFLTGPDSEENVVCGLGCGADHYILKPLRQMELLARIKALTRRTLGDSPAARTFDVPPYEFDLDAGTVTLHDCPIELTGLEFDLAVFLFRRVEQVLSREHLLEAVWNVSSDFPTRTVDSHICRLRTRLGLRGEHGYRLVPIRHIGYRLERLSERARATIIKARTARPVRISRSGNIRRN